MNHPPNITLENGSWSHQLSPVTKGFFIGMDLENGKDYMNLAYVPIIPPIVPMPTDGDI